MVMRIPAISKRGLIFRFTFDMVWISCSRETILREFLNSIREQYDVILLDCCPSLGMLTINALAAADEVVIPMQAHYLSIKGLEQLIHTISKVKLPPDRTTQCWREEDQRPPPDG